METIFEEEIENELGGVYLTIQECVEMLQEKQPHHELLWFYEGLDATEAEPEIREEYLKRFAPEDRDPVQADIAFCETLVDSINQLEA